MSRHSQPFRVSLLLAMALAILALLPMEVAAAGSDDVCSYGVSTTANKMVVSIGGCAYQMQPGDPDYTIRATGPGGYSKLLYKGNGGSDVPSGSIVLKPLEAGAYTITSSGIVMGADGGPTQGTGHTTWHVPDGAPAPTATPKPQPSATPAPKPSVTPAPSSKPKASPKPSSGPSQAPASSPKPTPPVNPVPALSSMSSVSPSPSESPDLAPLIDPCAAGSALPVAIIEARGLCPNLSPLVSPTPSLSAAPTPSLAAMVPAAAGTSTPPAPTAPSGGWISDVLALAAAASIIGLSLARRQRRGHQAT